jgi:hypothetical protein
VAAAQSAAIGAAVKAGTDASSVDYRAGWDHVRPTHHRNKKTRCQEGSTTKDQATVVVQYY